MKVLFDHQIFLLYKFGGVARYHFKLLKSLCDLKNDNIYEVVHYGTDNYYLDGERKVLNYKGRKKIVGLINNRMVINKLKNVSVFHPTYYDTYFINYKKTPNFVLTIHDMIPEWEFKSGNNVFKSLVEQKRKLLEKASSIIAISEATKKDILYFTSIDPQKVTVIHHGEPDYFFKLSAGDQMPTAKKDYFLYVGNRGGYKNFNILLTSLSSFLKKENVFIKVVGRELNKEEHELINRLGITEYILFINETSEEVLFNLYKNAICFIYPSLMEGFGIPILEAFYAECPVVCSDIPCFKEIAMNAALYFDPKSPESICSAVQKIYSDKQLQTELINKGMRRLNSFSWSNTAKATNAVYEKVDALQ